MGQYMQPIGTSKRETETGYQYQVTIYQAKNCSTCPLNGACHKQKVNRKIEVNKKLIAHKQKARENLNSEIGKRLRGRRCAEVEQTFGQIKSNKKFNRFLLRGLSNIKIEFGLVAIAHNLQKLHKAIIDDKTEAIINPIFNVFLKILSFISKTSIVKKNYSIQNIFIDVNLKHEYYQTKKAA